MAEAEAKTQKPATAAPSSSGPNPGPKAAPPPPSSSGSKTPVFTLGELVDLALCQPEVGAVNFNILRLLLRDLIARSGMEKTPAKMNDLEAHQVQNFKNHVQGANVASPMPGVLRISPSQGGMRPQGQPSGQGGSPRQGERGQPQQGQRGPPPTQQSPGSQGPSQQGERGPPPAQQSPGSQGPPQQGERGPPPAQQTQRGPPQSQGSQSQPQQSQGNQAAPPQSQGSQGSPPQNQGNQATSQPGQRGAPPPGDQGQARPPQGTGPQQKGSAPPQGQQRGQPNDQGAVKFSNQVKEHDRVLSDREIIMEVQDRVHKLERSLGASHELASNEEIFEQARQQRMSVSDMWQVIQLNNRISAAEAAIQKMATLIEDLAKNMGKVSTDTKNLKKDAADLVARKSKEFEQQGQDISGKYSEVGDTLTNLQKELNDIKTGWKQDRDNIEKALGINLSKLPANMKPINVKQTAPPPKPGQQPDRATQTQAQAQTQTKDGVKVSPRKAPEEILSAGDILKMTPDEIAEKVTGDDLDQMTPAAYKELSADQKKALRGVRKSVKAGEPAKPAMGAAKMKPEDLKKIPAKEISEKMPYEEAMSLTPEVLQNMTEEQKETVEKIKSQGPKIMTSRRSMKKPDGAGPSKKPQKVGVATMNNAELKEVKQADLAKMPYEEAKNIPPQVLQQMNNEQKEAVQKVLDAGSPRDSANDPDSPGPESPRLESPLPLGTTPDKPQSPMSQEEAPVGGTEQATTMVQKATSPEPMGETEKLSEEQAKEKSVSISEEQKRRSGASFQGEQAKDISLAPPGEGQGYPKEEDATDLGETSTHDIEDDEDGEKDKKKAIRKRPERSRHRDRMKQKHGHRSSDEDFESRAEKRKSRLKSKVGDALQIDASPASVAPSTMGLLKPPMTLEEFMLSLSPEEAAGMAADAVQKELEKQYRNLQGMQKQLAQDIQEKMEFIYQKLLTEIAAQQLSTTPFQDMQNVDICNGPGICEGRGIPPGVTVCQAPDPNQPQLSLIDQAKEGPAAKVCPGPGDCPGSDICPYCLADAEARRAIKVLKEPDTMRTTTAPSAASDLKSKPTDPSRPGTELDESILQEMRSLMLLDLEKLRMEMKSKRLGAYDEQDILERLGAVWEALNILKHNEEALAIRIAKQDAFIKKWPDKLQNIPEENLDMLVAGNIAKFLDDHHDRRRTLADPHKIESTHEGGGGGETRRDDVQTLFDNLASVISECAELKDRLDQLADTARILESGMVSRQMLDDALNDKADKGLMTTKVSYDEFGNTIDELHNQLHNIMEEGFQRNENWKKVASELAAELAEKLDKVELTPIRAFFKSHWKKLEDKVKELSRILEEPDPAGTRKKLYTEYNCLSCDRVAKISGVTNTHTLPLVNGPMPPPVRPQTAPKRANELNRMRPRTGSKCETSRGWNDKKNQLTTVEIAAQVANDMDVMHIANRYTGGAGSKGTIPTTNIMAAQQNNQQKTQQNTQRK